MPSVSPAVQLDFKEHNCTRISKSIHVRFYKSLQCCDLIVDQSFVPSL